MIRLVDLLRVTVDAESRDRRCGVVLEGDPKTFLSQGLLYQFRSVQTRPCPTSIVPYPASSSGLWVWIVRNPWAGR